MTHLQPPLMPGMHSLPEHSAADEQGSGSFNMLPGMVEEAHESLLEKDCKLEAQEQEINYLLNTIDDISSEMDKCKDGVKQNKKNLIATCEPVTLVAFKCNMFSLNSVDFYRENYTPFLVNQDIQQCLEKTEDQLEAQEEEISRLIQKIEELSAEVENLKDANQTLEAKEKELRSLQEALEMLSTERDRYKEIAEQAQRTADSMQADEMGVNAELIALQQQILSLTEALAKQKEESEKLQSELSKLKSTMSIVEITQKEESHKSVSAISLSSLTSSDMRDMLVQARSALSVVMMELEDSAKNMEILAQKNKILMAENEQLKQELETLQGGFRLTLTGIEVEQDRSGKEELLPKKEEKRMKDVQDYSSDQDSLKQKGAEDLDLLHHQLKACKMENEQLLSLISKQNAEIIDQRNTLSQLSELRVLELEGKSLESVKEEALLLQNQLQAERLRFQSMRDFLHRLQINTENVVKEAAQAAVSDDRLKRMGEVHLLENQYKAQKMESEKLWRLIASFKSDIETLRTVLPDNIIEVSTTICEHGSTSEEMQNLCNELIAAKEENRRLQDIVDNLRRGIDTMQHKLIEINIENDHILMQNQRSSSILSSGRHENGQLKVEVDDLTSRLTKFVTVYPEQSKLSADTDSIKELTKEVRCLHEKLIVNITNCTVETIKEENLRLEKLLKQRESEIAALREQTSEEDKKCTLCTCCAANDKILKKLDELEAHLMPLMSDIYNLRQKTSAKGPPTHLEIPIEVISASRKIDVVQSIDSSDDESGTKKLLSHLAAENELLKKHLERRTTYTPEIMHQLQEEKELLEKQLKSTTQIRESIAKKSIRFAEKPVDIIEIPQQQSVDIPHIAEVAQKSFGTSIAEDEEEKMINELTNVIELLKKQLNDANKTMSQLQEENELLKNQPATAEVDNERIFNELRNHTESLQKQLSDATETMVQLREENELLKKRRKTTRIMESVPVEIIKYVEKPVEVIKASQQPSIDIAHIVEVAQKSVGTSIAEDEEERMINELTNVIELLKKQLNDANKTMSQLQEENELLKNQPATAEVDNERIFNELRNHTESLQKQLSDATETMVQLREENELLKKRRKTTRIMESVPVEIIKYVEKPVEVIKASQQPSIDIAHIVEVAQKSVGTSIAEDEEERMINELTNVIELLKKQLNDANKTMSQLQEENELLKNQPATAEVDNERILNELRNHTESLQKQLSDATETMVQLREENELLKKRRKTTRIMEVAQKSVGTSIAEGDDERIINELTNVIELLKNELSDATKTMSQLQEENELLKNQPAIAEVDNERILNEVRTRTDSLQKQLSDATETMVHLREENELLKKQRKTTQIMEVAQKSVGTTIAEGDDERIINELTNVIELLKNELSDATKTMSQLQEENELLKNQPAIAEVDNERILNELRTRTDSLQKQLSDATETMVHLREENELLKKRRKTTRIMEVAQKSVGTSIAEGDDDRIINELTNVIELLKNELSDATKTMSQLQEENELLKNQPAIAEVDNERILKELRTRTESLQKQLSDATETMVQLREENELLKKRRKTTRIMESVPVEIIKYVEKPVEVIKAPQQQTVDIAHIAEVAQKSVGTSIAEGDDEKIINELTNVIEVLKNELSDATKTISQLQEENELLKNQPAIAEVDNERILKELRTRTESLQKQLSDATETMVQLQEENELLKKQQKTTRIMESVPVETIKYVEKPVEVIKAPQQQSLEIPHVAEVAPDVDTGRIFNEQRNQIESLEMQLSDAIERMSHLQEENELLKKQLDITQIKESVPKEIIKYVEKPVEVIKAPQQQNVEIQGISKVEQLTGGTSTAEAENESTLDELRSQIESLQKQLSDANNMIKSLESTLNELRNENESLKNELSSSNAKVLQLEDIIRKLTDGNDALKSMQIKDEISTSVKQIHADKIMETVPQVLAAPESSSVEPESGMVIRQLKTENESLRKDLEDARKALHTTSDDESEYEKTITELRTENERLLKEIEEARVKRQRDPDSTKIINQMNQENEMLRKQVEDLKTAHARRSTVGTISDKAYEQLMKDNEALRQRLENARASIGLQPTSVTHEADVVQLRIDNETLRKQLEDARKLAQSSQEQVLSAETDDTQIIDQLREENEFLKRRLESLTDITSSSAKEVVKYVEKPVEIIKTDIDSEKIINELRNQNESLQNELKDANTIRRELEEEVRKFKDGKQTPLLQAEQIASFDEKSREKEMSQLMEDNKLLNKQLLDATSTIEELTVNVTNLKDEIQRLQSRKISDLPSIVEDHTQEFQKLEAELQALRDENRRLHRDNEKLSLEVETLTEEQIPSTVALWKTEEKQLETVVDDQKRRITTLLSKMGKKEHPGEVAAWTREREHLLDTIRQLTKEAKEAKEAYEEKEEMEDRFWDVNLRAEMAGGRRDVEVDEVAYDMVHEGRNAAQGHHLSWYPHSPSLECRALEGVLRVYLIEQQALLVLDNDCLLNTEYRWYGMNFMGLAIGSASRVSPPASKCGPPGCVVDATIERDTTLQVVYQ
ncbi:putative leucine-rich repeat-containing protein DDB_G0290503 [Schistocerca americana]|uniref:putative leucine-rich repeat-containing protein DDB_G0290503 n=1 Tax=Schistocerca americana TaxID=7009 RepID=UPI001F4F9AAC|nr:putative leucine-rich repeat-containing protein DDB_G0290503 [Schistocerca americana]